MRQLILLKPHTHAGTRHSVGERLEVAQPSERWLIEHGIAEQIDGAGDTKPARRHLGATGKTPGSTTGTTPKTSLTTLTKGN